MDAKFWHFDCNTRLEIDKFNRKSQVILVPNKIPKNEHKHEMKNGKSSKFCINYFSNRLNFFNKLSSIVKF